MCRQAGRLGVTRPAPLNLEQLLSHDQSEPVPSQLWRGELQTREKLWRELQALPQAGSKRNMLEQVPLEF